MHGTLDSSLLGMVMGSGPVVQGVLIVLILLSLWSWGITIAKIMQFKKATEETKEFSDLFWEVRNLSRISEACDRLGASPLAKVFESGYKELNHLVEDRGEEEELPPRGEDVDSLKMALKRASLDEIVNLEKGTTFLATVASAAPFIGLFGTVWGIMNAFQGLSTVQTTTLQAVAPGISEALVATAIGLAAAIPAAIAYNYFTVIVKNFRGSMEQFSREFLNIAERNFI